MLIRLTTLHRCGQRAFHCKSTGSRELDSHIVERKVLDDSRLIGVIRQIGIRLCRSIARESILLIPFLTFTLQAVGRQNVGQLIGTGTEVAHKGGLRRQLQLRLRIIYPHSLQNNRGRCNDILATLPVVLDAKACTARTTERVHVLHTVEIAIREGVHIIRIQLRDSHRITIVESHTHEIIGIELVHGFHSSHTSWTILAPSARVLLHQRLVLREFRQIGHRESRCRLYILVVYTVQFLHCDTHRIGAGRLLGRNLNLQVCLAAEVAALHGDVHMLLNGLAANRQVIVDVADGSCAMILKCQSQSGLLPHCQIRVQLVGRQQRCSMLLHVITRQTNHHRIGTRTIISCLWQIAPLSNRT